MTYISDALREEVKKRASHRCEYCLLHENDGIYSHEVDHIIPEKHRGTTTTENLCYACLDCNRAKGSDFASFDPDTNEVIILFNPRKDKWSDHFTLENAYIMPITAKGRVTEFILKLNDPVRVISRELLIKVGRYPPKNY